MKQCSIWFFKSTIWNKLY